MGRTQSYDPKLKKAKIQILYIKPKLLTKRSEGVIARVNKKLGNKTTIRRRFGTY